MNKEFVEFEIAKELKELGFNELWRDNYYIISSLNKNIPIQTQVDAKDVPKNETLISSPLYQQVFKWFREKYNLHIEFIWDVFNSKLIWFASISEIGNTKGDCMDLKHCDTFEEAQLFGLKQLIKIIKDKNGKN